jgi:hypothetical protein
MLTLKKNTRAKEKWVLIHTDKMTALSLLGTLKGDLTASQRVQTPQ